MNHSKSEQQNIIRRLFLEGLEISGDTFNFRCPVCGDSKKDKNKKRGYFYWDNNQYKFKCHNCGVQCSLVWYLKQYEPDIYRAELYNTLKNKPRKQKYQENTKSQDLIKVSNQDVKKIINDLYEKQQFEHISETMDFRALNFMKDRKIPKEKYKYFFYCENFYELLYKPIKVFLKDIKQDTLKEENFKTDPRIFWFIKDRNNNIIGVQGRSLKKQTKIRYLTIRMVSQPMIMNIERINIHEKIMITEGYIDSLFLPNAVCLSGSNAYTVLSTLKDLGAKNMTFIYDNEPQNEEIKAKVVKIIEHSIKEKDVFIGICLLPKHIRKYGKDINDYIKNGFSKSKLLNIIDDNTYHGLKAKIKILRW